MVIKSVNNEENSRVRMNTDDPQDAEPSLESRCRPLVEQFDGAALKQLITDGEDVQEIFRVMISFISAISAELPACQALFKDLIEVHGVDVDKVSKNDIDTLDFNSNFIYRLIIPLEQQSQFCWQEE